MIARLSIQPNAANAMALEKNTKKHRTDLMTPKDFKLWKKINQKLFLHLLTMEVMVL
jgi:hypothetical protein